MRMYDLVRLEDVSGTSGTGRVAEVAEFGDGAVAVRWVAARNAAGIPSTTIFNSREDLLRVHGHEGRTRLEPVVDSGRMDQLETETALLKKRLNAAVATLKAHGLAIPGDPDSVAGGSFFMHAARSAPAGVRRPAP